ncbi:MAG TPA: exodeoxyribonuclease VII large subunit [Gemmatimonadales bacterium]|nr:exodeoxyribonuclease VII large subunit [Gemmatimonadales bacterium]
MSLPSLFGDGELPEELSVAELNRRARSAVEGSFGGAVFVRGELVEFKIWRSGHWYFTLRDADASVRCMLWKQQAAGVLKRHGQPPADGMEVLVRGKPTLWEEKGEYRLTATDIVPTALLGAKALELERVRAALKADGFLDPDRKRPLPPLARRIAVVTSPDGAALRDIITVARNRWSAVEIVLVGAQVQGEGAPASLVRALGLVNRIDAVDLCIVGRGGGAREDLGAFNAEPVCRALAAVRVPTISAVGHETDVSLSDLVADARAATPSAAAELAVPERRALVHRVDGFGVRLAAGLRRRTRVAEERLARTGDRLHASLSRMIEARRGRVDRAAAQLDALSPLRVLARGYSVAQDDTGRVLSRAADFPSGRQFRLRVSDGAVPARAE